MELTAIQLLGLMASGGVLLELVKAVVKWVQGKQQREHNVWVQRDREARIRRMLEQHVHEQRLVMLVHGVPADEIPAWPDYDTKD